MHDHACISTGDTSWVLVSAILILGMMPALGLFEGGLLRSKNTVSILTQIMGGIAILSCLWYIIGFSLVFGPDVGGVIGSPKYFLLIGVPVDDCLPQAPNIPGVAYVIFEMMFAAITPLLLTGTYAERISFRPFVVFTVLWEVIVYYPLAHWVWGGGWLAKLKVIDFAGGIVIHTSAGAAAIVAALYLGHRKDFHKWHGEAPPSSIPLAVLGGALLWMGWFGFNAGSALTAGSLAANTVMNTQIASSTSAMVWFGISVFTSDHGHNVVHTLNGAIAGLAGITPASGYVSTQSAFVIGVIIGFGSFYSIALLKGRLEIDDALDVSSVHGVPGVIGSLAIGFVGSKAVNDNGEDGWLYGNPKQIGIQLLGVVVAAAWAGIWTYIFLKVIDMIMGVRTHRHHEEKGLDHHEHGIKAYNDLHNSSSYSSDPEVNGQSQPTAIPDVTYRGAHSIQTTAAASGSAASPPAPAAAKAATPATERTALKQTRA